MASGRLEIHPRASTLGASVHRAEDGANSDPKRKMLARRKRMSGYMLRSTLLVLTIGLSVHAMQLTASYADDEPDLIFKRSTVFKWVTPNDKLATYGLDDPDVEGVACHFTVPERGGLTGWIGVAEEVSDISLACSQVGPIHFKRKFSQGEDMFRQRRSLFFKKMQIVRGCDVKRNVLVYMVYSDKLIEGSPKNSTSSVPVMPWGTDGQVEKCADWIER
jgi:CreA protein